MIDWLKNRVSQELRESAGLHIQVMFRDEAVAPTGVDELVHYRKTFDTVAA